MNESVGWRKGERESVCVCVHHEVVRIEEECEQLNAAEIIDIDKLQFRCRCCEVVERLRVP